MKIKKVSKLYGSYLFADILSKGVFFFLTPVYTNYLSTDEFGILTFAKSIHPIISVILSFGMQAVAFRFYFVYLDKRERKRFYGSIWLFLLVMAGVINFVITLIGVFFLNSLFMQVPFHPYLTLTIWTTYLRVGFELIFLQYLRAKQEAKIYLFLSIASFLLFTIFQLLFVIVLKQGVIGALWANFISVFLISLIYAYFMLREFTLCLDIEYLHRALSYGLPMVPHFISSWGLNLSDRVILERFVSLANIGVYSLADQFRQGYQLFINGFEKATRPAYGRASISKSKDIKISKLITYYVFFLATVGMTILVYAPEVVELIATVEYAFAKQLIPWLILGMFFQGIYTIPMNILTQLVGKTKGIAWVTFVAGIVNITLNLIFVPRHGIFAAAVNTSIGYLILFILIFMKAKDRINYEYARIGKNLLVALLISITGVLLKCKGWTLRILLKSIMIMGYPVLLNLIGFFKASEKEVFFTWLNSLKAKGSSTG